MSYSDSPFSRGQSDADMDRNLRAGFARIRALPWLQIAGWGGLAVVLWVYFEEWLVWGAALGCIATLAYTYRDSAPLRFLRERVWDAFWDWALRRFRGYAHAYERQDAESQRDSTISELARIKHFENDASDNDGAGAFLANARPAMEQRLDQLLQIPKPSKAQHQERSALEGWLKQDRARAGALIDAPTLLGFAAAPAPSASSGGVLSVVNGFASKWALWIIGPLVALLGVQTLRVDRLKQEGWRVGQELKTANATIGAMEERIQADAARLQAITEARVEDGLRLAETELANARRLEAERRRTRSLQASLRRLEDARAQMGSGGVVDFRDQLRELVADGEAGEPAAGDAPDAGAADPGL